MRADLLRGCRWSYRFQREQASASSSSSSQAGSSSLFRDGGLHSLLPVELQKVDPWVVTSGLPRPQTHSGHLFAGVIVPI